MFYLAIVNTVQIALPFHPFIAGSLLFLGVFLAIRIVITIWSKIIP